MKAEVPFHLYGLSQLPDLLPRESHSYELGVYLLIKKKMLFPYVWICHRKSTVLFDVLQKLYYVVCIILQLSVLNIFWALST